METEFVWLSYADMIYFASLAANEASIRHDMIDDFSVSGPSIFLQGCVKIVKRNSASMLLPIYAQLKSCSESTAYCQEHV
jgi:hypothetical protein